LKKNFIDHSQPVFEHFAPLYGPGDVPGYLSQGSIEVIESLCDQLPDSGVLVEVGSFLGKSAVEFAKNFDKQNKDYTILCIDSFNSPIEILRKLLQDADFVIPDGVSDNLSMFKHYTKNYKNIFPIVGFFNETFDFPGKVQMVYDDSTHAMSYMNHALPFWWEHIVDGGMLAGHNYTATVRTAVDIFAALKRLPVDTFSNKQSTVWCVRKP
jgi:hypothetical protein